MSSFTSLIFQKNRNRHEQIALVDRNGSRESSWDELRAAVYAVADYAAAHKPEGVIPVYMDRSLEAFATLMGLNLSGVGVAPLAITTPRERCEDIARQVNNPIWTIETYEKAVAEAKTCPHRDWDAEIAAAGETEIAGDNSAYVVFTSGSTGKPKGVVLSDNAIFGGMLRAASRDFFGYEESSVPLQSASFSFIAVAADLLAPLYAGCTTHILPEEARGDNALLSGYIRRHNITSLFTSPQLYRSLDGGPSLRCVCIGGDRIINIAPKGHRLVSVYGMTEMSGFAFHYDIEEATEFTPIGFPSVGVKVYIIDEDGNPADEGELCVSGSVAHEYLNRPELNAATFTSNPFCDEKGHELLLHSGDIVRKIDRGGFRYLNRRDNMLKINGQRVEPGEIELVLSRFEGMDTVAVKGFSDEEGRSILCAYYTSAEPLDDEQLRCYLEERLPHYMVPVSYTRLEKMPLNANGKLDRPALKLPDFSAFTNEYAAPENELQAALCRAFETVLQLRRVGIHDDFFRLGGDSIRALALCRECEEQGLLTTAVFAGRTPEGIAEQLRDGKKDLYTSLQSELPLSPLTDSQLGVYLDCIRSSECTKYNIPVHMTLTRPALSDEELKKRIDAVLALHPALYACTEQGDEGVMMRREAFPAGGICTVEEGSEAELSAQLRGWVKPFDLTKSPLCRARAILTEEKLHILLDMHHLVSDGSSVSILKRELCASLAGQELSAEGVDAFSLYEAEQLRRGNGVHELAHSYFDLLLSGVDGDWAPLCDGKAVEGEPGRRYSLRLDAAPIAGKLGKTDITESTLFMTAFGYALAKFAGSENCLFAVAESGRDSAALESTVSMLVRTLPVVLSMDETQSGRKLLGELQSQLYRSMKYDCISYAALCRDYGISMDATFVYQSDLLSDVSAGELSAQVEMLETGSSVAKLGASVLKYDGFYELRLEYRSDLYTEATIRRFATLYAHAVEGLLSEAPLREISLMDEDELALLDSFNRIPQLERVGGSFVDAFARTAAAYPDTTAVVYKDVRLSYAELDELSNRIAAYIHSQGIGREETVSVLIERSEWIPVIMLGINKSGAVYEPLDVSYPAERLNFMMQDAKARLLIADRSLVSVVNEYTGSVLYTDELTKLPPTPENLLPTPRGEDTFMLLYTSGTTGKPKGVMISHANVISYAQTHADTLRVSHESVMTFYPSYAFDASLAELCPCFFVGSTLHIIPEEMRLDFPALKDYIEREGITHLLMTTQVAWQFAAEYPEVKGLQCISCGGEKLPTFPLPKNYRFLNLYGPTETTVCCTAFELDREYENIPIGHVTGEMRLYVADAFGRRVSVGVPGELIICGAQVSKGYLNRAEKTAEVFVSNCYEPSATGVYERCYRSGDVVRYLPDGNIEFIGRRDLQVKIRGFRIELSEVEQVIRSCPGVKDATVIAVDEKSGKAIHAYIVADSPVDIGELNRFIREQKPAYMVPAATMQIDSIPLTPNGKVDKRKLPKIEKAPTSEGSGKRSLTNMENALMGIVREVVGEQEFDVETELTELGISSISSIRLASLIYKRTGIRIDARDILNHGNVLHLENLIVNQLLSGGQAPTETRTVRKSYPLTQTQTGIYLDCLRAGMEAYNIPLLLRLPAEIDTEKLRAAVVTAVKAHPSMLCRVSTDEEGEPVLCPAGDMEVTVSEETISALPPEQTAFRFDADPLFRFRILHLGEERYFFMECHHIISDGESMTLLLHHIDAAYRGESVESEEYTVFDLCLDEAEDRGSAKMDDARAYYDSVFRGLSADYLPVPNRDELLSPDAYERALGLSPEQVESFCTAHGITENVFFTSVFAILLGRYTSHEDALFTTIYNGRTDPRTQGLSAMLVKTLPIYVNLSGDTAVGDYVTAVQKHLGKIRQYDLFSFADAAKEYGLKAEMMFIYQGRMLSEASLDGHTLEQLSVGSEGLKAEICAELYSEERDFRLRLEYNGGHYSEEWMNSFADAYATCAKNLLKCEKLSQVEILSPAGYRMFASFNDTDVSVPYCPACELLEKQAKLQGDRVAVIAHADSEIPGTTVMEQLSFRQLDRMANALAWKILSLKLPGEGVVGFLCDRTKEVHVSEFGILKSGNAFLFLSPSYPDDRISYIVEESGMKVLITTHRFAKEKSALLETLKLTLIYADDIDPDIRSTSPGLRIRPDALAYLTYTSGSTGKPKGVMLTQENLRNICDTNEKNLALTPLVSSMMAASFAFTFDASLLTTVMSITAGMSVCIASEEEIHSPEKFRTMCLRYGVTAMAATPSFFMSLLDLPSFADVVRGLKSVQCGGETFPAALYTKLRAINPELCIVNAYGPSETTVACTAKLLDSAENITIGRPLHNYRLHIIDKYNHILPMGALGELVIKGKGVGRGYMNRDDLTSKVFIRLPDGRAYRSGDLALITHEGEVEFHGRIDNQVKLRGLRIELGEIENAINSYPGVKNSIVLLMGPENNRYLAAYYTADHDIAQELIIEHISKTLASYMVPRAFMQLSVMPLTANGKIDKKALPDIQSARRGKSVKKPKTETEKTICELYREILGLSECNLDDNFFELGGSSLTASRAVMQLKSRGIELEYQDIFDHQTPEELSLYLKLKGEGTVASAVVFTDEDGTPEELRPALAHNTLEYAPQVSREPLGNVLLTGATGFLGIHVLKELLETEEGTILCLVRKSHFSSSEQHLDILSEYYFSEAFTETYGARLKLVDGDITADTLERILEPYAFDTIINCAASVKHFASDNSIEHINVHGVENLITIAKARNARLVQVSTTSVIGAHTPETLRMGLKLHENQCFSADDMNNRYLISKLHAEQKLLAAVNEGLRGKIVRVGNLMGRYSDGEFQINMGSNAFLNALKGLVTMGKAPMSHCTDPMEYTPVDLTARAIVLLSGTNDMFTLFHANQRFIMDEISVFDVCTRCGMPIRFVPDEEYYSEYNRLLGDESVNRRLAALVTNDRPDIKTVEVDNTFTVQLLFRLGFRWPLADDSYLERVFTSLRDIGFFR